MYKLYFKISGDLPAADPHHTQKPHPTTMAERHGAGDQLGRSMTVKIEIDNRLLLL